MLIEGGTFVSVKFAKWGEGQPALMIGQQLNDFKVLTWLQVMGDVYF